MMQGFANCAYSNNVTSVTLLCVCFKLTNTGYTKSQALIYLRAK